MVAPLLWSPPADMLGDEALAALRARLDARLREAGAVPGRKVLLTSLSVEDMAITEAVCRLRLDIEPVAIDTGLLHAETLALLDAAGARFGREIRVVRPDDAAVRAYVAAHGLHAMYESPALRRACCHVRKVVPLDAVLQGAAAWLTGQRSGQSVTRSALAFAEFDAARGLRKFNPVFDFSEAEVWAYARAFDLPLNALYRRGFPSIGCAPCTKPVRAGEDSRAGRWWWEQADNRECGLHVHA